MKDRLKEFMLYKSLNAADLADKIGVQRSNISHILNGRNNPGALFMEKLLNAFPDLNSDWLITGRGKMLKTPVEILPELKTNDAGEILEVMPSEQKNAPIQKSEVIHEFQPQLKERKVEKIIFFYSDMTFSTYFPGI